MTCDRARELLPWFANGSLDEAEAHDVERHLAECEGCRAELAEIGAAFEIFDEHLAAETLTAIAFEGASRSPVVETHLAECAICSDRLAMARASRAELDAAEAEPSRDRRLAGAPVAPRSVPPPWRNLALAASLATLVTAAGWLWTWQSASPPSTLRGGEPAAQGASGVLHPPAVLNVAVVEISPTLVGDASEAAEIPLEAPIVTLILRTWLDAGPTLGARLTTEDGSVAWTRVGLEPRPDGTYALALPTAGSAPGLYRLTLLDGEGRDLESYALRFR